MLKYKYQEILVFTVKGPLLLFLYDMLHVQVVWWLD